MGKVRDLHGVLRVPLLTEKAHELKELERSQVVFRVAPEANKAQIKAAVEKLLKAKVAGVNVINVRGKAKRLGKTAGRRSDWKKAIVTLRAGEKIEIIEGVS